MLHGAAAIGKRLGRPPIAPALEKRIREALATPGRPGVRVIAKRFGVDPGTVQRSSFALIAGPVRRCAPQSEFSAHTGHIAGRESRS
jgi:hypothetical protein